MTSGPPSDRVVEKAKQLYMEIITFDIYTLISRNAGFTFGITVTFWTDL